jgi:Ca-activated chloride channel homolog
MTRPLPLLSEDDVRRELPEIDEAGFGSLTSKRGPLPLKAMDVRGRIDGLLAQVSVCQTFVNTLDQPIEATYIFPLPDRAAVTSFHMEVGGRVVEGVLKERAQARRAYDEAIAAGNRATIAEEERAGVFTLRVGNLMPGDQATIRLTLTGPLPYSDGEVTFRFPLVVAPRYIPGAPLSGPSVGDGVASDTDAVPDASRITPPVLLPGYPNPVQLSLAIDIHTEAMPVRDVRSSLHSVLEEEVEGLQRVTLKVGERLNRDFVLRFRLAAESVATALSVHPDSQGDDSASTFALTVVPPSGSEQSPRPRDVVFVLDRSGSMEGWKMVAARRALARMVDALNNRDRFQVYAFDEVIETAPALAGTGLHAATDRNRFRAVEFLAALQSRGGTEMAQPLDLAVQTLAAAPSERERILVLVTDGQVGNEDQILRTIGSRVQGIRIFALGIDQAVNEAFLRRLAGLCNGVCDFVESEARLDAVMDAIHRRIGTPVLTDLRLEPTGLSILPDTLVPSRLPDLFAGAPLLILGRNQGTSHGGVILRATDASGQPWSQPIAASARDNPAIASAWARGRIRELEDRFVLAGGDRDAIERQIVATSLAYSVLSRFTAYVAVDSAETVNPGGVVHQVTQPVESPEGWDMLSHRVCAYRMPLDRTLLHSLNPMSPRSGRLGAAMPPASAYDLEETADAFVADMPDPSVASGLWQASASASVPNPASEDSAQMGSASRRFSQPVLSRSAHKSLLARLWRALRRGLQHGTPPALDLIGCRRLAMALSERLDEAMTGPSSARLRRLRAVARDLGHLVDMMRIASPTAPELSSLVEVHEALTKLISEGKPDTVALADQVSRTKAALDVFAVEPASISAPERKEEFWK